MQNSTKKTGKESLSDVMREVAKLSRSMKKSAAATRASAIVVTLAANGLDAS